MPEAIPALEPLGDALLAAFEAGQGGSIGYCQPESIDAPLDEECSQGAWHVAGYEPVRDPIRDEVLFIIVVDVPEGIFLEPIRQQTMLSVAGGVLFAVLLIVASVVVAKTMARPIHELTAAARAIEHDEAFEPESIAGVAAQGDELGQLARVFRDMALAVQERERKLKNQVRQLRIQIDEEKRQRQVKEIVEDDFFQDLQARARERRGEQ